MMLLTRCVSSQEINAVPAKLIIPDGTAIELRLAESVSSAHAHVGDLLTFVVVKDVNIGGFTVVEAGTMARGYITAVKGRRLLGFGGKVVFKLGSVGLVTGDRAQLLASKEVKGGSHTMLMMEGAIVTSLIFLPAAPAFLLARGQNCIVTKSTEITAQTDGDISIPVAELLRPREGSREMVEMMDYLPSRVFDGKGREGDMINLIFVAKQEDLQNAFQRAGWIKTDTWSPIFIWHMLRRGVNDTKLPMSRFYLFGRVQDYAFALPDPSEIVSRRHHLRIWKTNYTIEKTPVWAAAATYDVAIEIAKRGRLLNHKIDPDVDAERDFIGTALMGTASVSRREYLPSASPIFKAETTTGEPYHSDSRILLLMVASAKTIASNQSLPGVWAAPLSIVAPVKRPPNNMTSHP
jgi:hypothetical protein